MFYIFYQIDTKIILAHANAILYIHDIIFYRSLSSKSEKILILSYLFFNMTILSIYSGNINHIFNKLDKFTLCNTFDKFLDSEIPVLPFRHEIGLYFTSDHVTKRGYQFQKFSGKIKYALKLINDLNTTFQISNFDTYAAKGFAILSSVSIAKREITESMKRNHGETSLIILDIIPNEFGRMVFLMNKEIRFLQEINDMILNLIASNVVERWYENSVDDYLRKMVVKIKKKKDIHALQVVEFRICFILYAFGIMFSAIAFLGEVLLNAKCVRKYRTRKAFFVTRARFLRFLNLKKGPKVAVFRPVGTKVAVRAYKFRSGCKFQ